MELIGLVLTVEYCPQFGCCSRSAPNRSYLKQAADYIIDTSL